MSQQTEIIEEKKFEANAKKFFITFSDEDADKITREDLIHHCDTDWQANKYAIAKEHFCKGGIHWHILIERATKLHTRNCREFDFDGHHCNFKPVSSKKAWDSKIIYCNKSDPEVTWVHTHPLQDRTFVGYKRRKEDYYEYEADKRYRALGDIRWPIILPDGVTTATETKDKRRHYCIIAPSDFGKNKWINETFKGTKTYMRPDVEKFPFDNYQDEQVIIYNAIWPKWRELENVTDTHDLSVGCYGGTRYHMKTWKLGQWRTVFLLNTHPHVYEGREEEFKNRFYTLTYEEYRWHLE